MKIFKKEKTPRCIHDWGTTTKTMTPFYAMS